MATKIKLCKEKGCNNQQTTGTFCRFHYLRNWKKLQSEKKQKAAKHLERYVENIVRSTSEPSAAVKNKKDDFGFEKPEEAFQADSLREVMAELGYRDNFDKTLVSIQVDEDF